MPGQEHSDAHWRGAKGWTMGIGEESADGCFLAIFSTRLSISDSIGQLLWGLLPSRGFAASSH